jgi:hypothetical protein
MAQMEMAKAQQELQSPTMGQLAAMDIQQRSQASEQKTTIDAANVAVKEKDSEIKFLELLAKIKSENVDAELKMAKTEAEQTRSAVDMAINLSSHQQTLSKSKENLTEQENEQDKN